MRGMLVVTVREGYSKSSFSRVLILPTGSDTYPQFSRTIWFALVAVAGIEAFTRMHDGENTVRAPTTVGALSYPCWLRGLDSNQNDDFQRVASYR